jgi:hypothetical protein
MMGIDLLLKYMNVQMCNSPWKRVFICSRRFAEKRGLSNISTPLMQNENADAKTDLATICLKAIKSNWAIKPNRENHSVILVQSAKKGMALTHVRQMKEPTKGELNDGFL